MKCQAKKHGSSTPDHLIFSQEARGPGRPGSKHVGGGLRKQPSCENVFAHGRVGEERDTNIFTTDLLNEAVCACVSARMTAYVLTFKFCTDREKK